MKNVPIKLLFTIMAIAIFIGCGDDDDNSNTPAPDVDQIALSAVVENYSNLVYQSYLDSYNAAVSMQTAINTFVETPTEANFDAAKDAWLVARDIYGQTEAYREANGPIDTEESASTPWGIGNEGQINAWPIDEGYIDFIQAGTEAFAGDFTSIISDNNITIDQVMLITLNEQDSDKSISTGWHAIEFLLWGQDNTSPSENLSGQRLFTDYTTLENADRRGQYLTVVTSLLVSDLQSLVDTWNVGGAYRVVFEALDEEIALTQLINGAFFIAGDELSSERIIAPLDSTDGIDNSGQEDEHSCFSDNTDRDIVANAQGVYNVIFGEFGNISGASFFDLVQQADEAQAQALQEASDAAMASVVAIDNSTDPFDFLITQENTTDITPGVVLQSVVALQAWADVISESAAAININL